MLGAKNYIENLDPHFIEILANKVVEALDERERKSKQKKCTHAGLHPVPSGPYDDVVVRCGHCMRVWK
jgi:hypothetical protein